MNYHRNFEREGKDACVDCASHCCKNDKCKNRSSLRDMNMSIKEVEDN